MKLEAGIKIPILRVDGGGTANSLLMQFQADITNMPIQVAAVAETTALGVAYLAGLATGQWKNTDEIAKKWRSSATFEPKMPADQREQLYSNWLRAVERAHGWIKK